MLSLFYTNKNCKQSGSISGDTNTKIVNNGISYEMFMFFIVIMLIINMITRYINNKQQLALLQILKKDNLSSIVQQVDPPNVQPNVQLVASPPIDLSVASPPIDLSDNIASNTLPSVASPPIDLLDNIASNTLPSVVPQIDLPVNCQFICHQCCESNKNIVES